MSERVHKVNQQIKEEVSSFLHTNLGAHNGIFSVTAVNTTPDLRYATIWYSYLGEDLKGFERDLAEHSRALQRYVNSRLTMKYVPKLAYRFDKSGEYAQQISKIIDEAK